MSWAYRKPRTRSQHVDVLADAMSTGEPAQTTLRRTPSPVIGALVVAVAALVGIVAHESQAASSPVAPPAPAVSGARAPSRTGLAPDQPTIAVPPLGDDFGGFDGLGVDDGAVPRGVTVFEEDLPAVARLDPSLLEAVRRAANGSAADGIDLVVNSGWRSPQYQERLLEEAVSRYGSTEEAGRWVATPDTSAHDSGHAIDIGPPAAATWLSQRGSAYGLCQIYRNEPWHFELRPEATEHGCPTMYTDPTHDPRMQL
jgi:D-alanyl-D-alanine carboxypeptidase